MNTLRYRLSCLKKCFSNQNLIHNYIYIIYYECIYIDFSRNNYYTRDRTSKKSTYNHELTVLQLIGAKLTMSNLCLSYNTIYKSNSGSLSSTYVTVGSAGSLSINSCSAGSLSFGLFLIRIWGHTFSVTW